MLISKSARFSPRVKISKTIDQLISVHHELWMKERFEGSFTQQEAIPEDAIDAAVEVMRTGRLHRYNVADGEVGEVAHLEHEFASVFEAKYCLAVASGGYALATALRTLGVGPGHKVLTNAFTLAPVPGSIVAVGALPVFVGVTENLVIDLEDLAEKACQANVLMLSHMRGHICDMDTLMHICDQNDITVIEDCAHTMGAKWRDRWSGRYGAIGCYSTQTYKHINSGEGGFLITDDAQVMARAIVLSGSYMLYDRHLAGPDPTEFEKIRYETPNISGRMDHLRASILRPQLRRLNAQCEAWAVRYKTLEYGLQDTPGLSLTERPPEETYVGSSIQVLLLDWSPRAVREVIMRCAERGVELKWFGSEEPIGFTSRYDSWTYVPSNLMPKSDRILAGLLDMRIPLTFSIEDCALIARIIREEVCDVYQSTPQVAK